MLTISIFYKSEKIQSLSLWLSEQYGIHIMDLRNASASGNLTRWMVYQCFSPWCLIALWCIYDIQDFVDILQKGFQLLPSYKNIPYPKPPLSPSFPVIMLIC